MSRWLSTAPCGSPTIMISAIQIASKYSETSLNAKYNKQKIKLIRTRCIDFINKKKGKLI